MGVENFSIQRKPRARKVIVKEDEYLSRFEPYDHIYEKAEDRQMDYHIIM